MAELDLENIRLFMFHLKKYGPGHVLKILARKMSAVLKSETPGRARGNETKKINIEGHEFTILSKPRLSKDQLLRYWWYFHPRFRFFKTLPSGSKLLDIGAGPGGISCWKEWNWPLRDDLTLYGIDLRESELAPKYFDFKICDLNAGPIPYEDCLFDAVLMSHVLEHLKDEAGILKEIGRVLKKTGRLYIEIPSEETLGYPGRAAFLKEGIKVSSINFFDDGTHLRTFPLPVLEILLEEKSGFRVLESGTIENKFIEDELFTYGYLHEDEEMATYGVWSKLRWAKYLICEKE